MANQFKMAIISSILSLHAQGLSIRRIAQTLGVSRDAVSRQIRRNLQTESTEPQPNSNKAIAPIDPARVIDPSNLATAPTGPEDSKKAIAPTGSPRGRQSQAARWRAFILAGYDDGLSAVRIHEDLKKLSGAEHVSYDSVRRLLRREQRRQNLPFRRMECAPGEEAQVDYGTGVPIVTSEGKLRKTHLFRIVLSHSRKAYSEVRYRQTTDDFLACLENAFYYFGGVPNTLVIDNLKAAVKHPDWYDPELTPKVRDFAKHYGTVILPTKPRMPRHKGKVESGVKYAQNNALKKRRFSTLEGENEHLLAWEENTADTRIHGTTKRQVGKVFQEVERSALLPLPRERFPSFHEGKRIVNRDGHVEVAKAYYSAPPEYLGVAVWVRWDARTVRIFNHRWEQIRMHVRIEPGRFSTDPQDIHPRKISGLELGAEQLMAQANKGPHTEAWAQAVLHARGIEATRVLLGLVALAKKHPPADLEKACEIAVSHGEYRLRTLRGILKRQPTEKQMTMEFLEEHPIIRPLSEYSQVVARAFERQRHNHAHSGFLRDGGVKESGGSEESCAKKDPEESQELTRGSVDFLPHRSEYPLPGCTSAEPDSVSPDKSMLLPFPPDVKELSDA